MQADPPPGPAFELVEDEDLATLVGEGRKDRVELGELFVAFGNALGGALRGQLFAQLGRGVLVPTPASRCAASDSGCDAARVAPERLYGQSSEAVPPCVELEEDGLEAVLHV